jgi:hypothetical protein
MYFTRLHGNTPVCSTESEYMREVTTRDQPVSSISDDRVLLVSRYPESSVCACMVAITSCGVHLSAVTFTPVLSRQAPYQTGWVYML